MRANVPAVLLLGAALAALASSSAQGQQPLRKQIKNDDPLVALTTAELAELGDPLFQLVLKDHPGATKLTDVEQLLQPQAKDRQLFVVGEESVDLNPKLTQRAVVAFSGTTNGIILSPNVMLSVIFTGNRFPTDPSPPATTPPTPKIPFIEAWGWDANRGRYNYYRMDNGGGGASWKFRGSSLDADLLSAAARADTCFQCHLNGAPVMKELPLPWNHWHSSSFRLPQLDPLQSPMVRWPVATEARFGPPGGLGNAYDLEQLIRTSIQVFSASQMNRQLETTGGGVKVRDAKRLLRSLFKTTEFNMASSRVRSNMHPLSTSQVTEPSLAFDIPPSFFINSEFILGGASPGLGISEAVKFPGANVASIKPAEYRALVTSKSLKIRGQAGDANFAWLTPEPALVDNQLCGELVRRGVVPGQFAAAVMAIDVRMPMLSKDREKLLKLIPAEFEIGAAPPSDVHDVAFFANHQLTKATIQALEGLAPAVGSVELDFLKLLRQDGGPPREILRARVKQYSQELRTALEDPIQRDARLKQLFDQLVERRRAVLDHPELKALDETGGKLLFPAP